MKIIETLSEIEKLQKASVLSIGNFDGVHIGHQQIIKTAKDAAKETDAELIAMTFEPHPVAILYPEKAAKVLTPLKLKEYLLSDLGVDCLIVLKDTAELLKLSAADFVEQFLVKVIKPSRVIEGEDFNFGYGRSGNVYMLKSIGTEKGFDVGIVEPKTARFSIGHAVKVSSTLIRNLLASGKVADAAVALNRPYRLIGKIISGKGKGRELGFPTLNMQKPEQIIPAEGVYTGFVELAGSEEEIYSASEKKKAVFSIGRTKTYGDDQPLLIEAHLLEENPENLVGKWMAMDFVEHIRPQQIFETEADLSAQIANDCKKARETLAVE